MPVRRADEKLSPPCRQALAQQPANPIGWGKGHVSGHREVAERDDAGGNHPGLRRETCSFNAVTNYTNILHKAYCDFPQPRVLPVYMETIIEIPEGEHLFYAESGFATSVDGFLNNSRVYTADNAGKRYLYENGKKRELGPNDPGDFQAKGARTEPTYGAWTSASGTRKVTYTRDGSLTLHDGTSFYPLAFKKESDRLVWIIASSAGVENARTNYSGYSSLRCWRELSADRPPWRRIPKDL